MSCWSSVTVLESVLHSTQTSWITGASPQDFFLLYVFHSASRWSQNGHILTTTRVGEKANFSDGGPLLPLHCFWCHPAIKSTLKGIHCHILALFSNWCLAEITAALLVAILDLNGAEVGNYLEMYLKIPDSSKSNVLTRALLTRFRGDTNVQFVRLCIILDEQVENYV